MQPTPVFLPGESHEWRGLVSHSPWDCRESDTTEQLTHILTLKNHSWLIWGRDLGIYVFKGITDDSYL